MQRKQPSQATDTKVTLPASGETEVLTVKETAALLKVPMSSVYEWTRFRGNQRMPIPHRRVGKYLRFLRSEIDAWLVGLPKAANTRKRKYIRSARIGRHESRLQFQTNHFLNRG